MDDLNISIYRLRIMCKKYCMLLSVVPCDISRFLFSLSSLDQLYCS